MEAVSLAWLCGFKSAGKELEFCFVKATNFGTIGPRSRRDRATIYVLVARLSASDRLEAIPLLKLPDRGSIAPRLRFDRTAIAEFFHWPSAPSDQSSGYWTIVIHLIQCTPIIRRVHCQLSDESVITAR